jgi:hypothetical protein
MFCPYFLPLMLLTPNPNAIPTRITAKESPRLKLAHLFVIDPDGGSFASTDKSNPGVGVMVGSRMGSRVGVGEEGRGGKGAEGGMEISKARILKNRLDPEMFCDAPSAAGGTEKSTATLPREEAAAERPWIWCTWLIFIFRSSFLCHWSPVQAQWYRDNSPLGP